MYRIVIVCARVDECRGYFIFASSHFVHPSEHVIKPSQLNVTLCKSKVFCARLFYIWKHCRANRARQDVILTKDAHDHRHTFGIVYFLASNSNRLRVINSLKSPESNRLRLRCFHENDQNQAISATFVVMTQRFDE